MIFDGVNQPRPAQTEILNWINEHRHTTEVLGIQAPTGTGKSAILKAVADVIITPANHLIEQYTASYPGTNVLKGAEHYTCKRAGDCQTHRLLFQRSCENCPLSAAKNAARRGEQTLANPLSYYYLRQDAKFQPPNVLGIDEADKLEGMLALTATLEIPHKTVSIPKVARAIDLLPWLEQAVEAAVASKKFGVAGSYKRIAQMIENYPTNYNVHRATDSTLLYPFELTGGFLQTVTKCKTLILMSATLFERDVRKIAGARSYKYLEVDSPIPVENRRVYYIPMKVSGRPTPREVATWVKEMQTRFPSRGTICHLTYGMQTGTLKHLKGAFKNTKKDKPECQQRLKDSGGLWLASGCHEGVDLVGDAARLNLIPVIPYDHFGDTVVSERFKRDRDGYYLDALRRIIQQAGRTTRGPDDSSVIVVGDPRFPALVNKYKDKIPKSFFKSIVWRVK